MEVGKAGENQILELGFKVRYWPSYNHMRRSDSDEPGMGVEATHLKL